MGNDVWIGAGATILPGARIGDGVIVGAGAVVGGTVPPYTVVAGNPARVIRLPRPPEDRRPARGDCLVELADRGDPRRRSRDLQEPTPTRSHRAAPRADHRTSSPIRVTGITDAPRTRQWSAASPRSASSTAQAASTAPHRDHVEPSPSGTVPASL